MKNEDFKMEPLSDSEFYTLDSNEMTKVVGEVRTVTCYVESVDNGDDGDDSDW